MSDGAGHDYLNPKQVALMLGVSWSTVYRLIRAGELAARRIGIGTGSLKVTPAEVDRYLRDAEKAAATDLLAAGTVPAVAS